METKIKVGLTILLIGLLNMIPLVLADEQYTFEMEKPRCLSCDKQQEEIDPEPIVETNSRTYTGQGKGRVCDLDYRDDCDFNNKGLIKVQYEGKTYQVKKVGISLLGSQIVKIEGSDGYEQYHPIRLFKLGIWEETTMKGLFDYLIGE